MCSIHSGRGSCSKRIMVFKIICTLRFSDTYMYKPFSSALNIINHTGQPTCPACPTCESTSEITIPGVFMSVFMHVVRERERAGIPPKITIPGM